MGKRSELDPKRRTEAVLALLRREEPGVRIARRYGVSEPTLYRWRDEFLQAGQLALAGAKNGGAAERQRIEKLERELARRDQVIGELTIANRILKKLEDGLI
jgi:transposase-like protein